MQYGPTQDRTCEDPRNCQQIWYGVYIFAHKRRRGRASRVVCLLVGPTNTAVGECSGDRSEGIVASGF
jgi:hypothetical protein